MERNKDDLFFASRAGTFTFLLLCRMSSFSPTKSDSKWEKIYFSYFKWKNSNFQILSEKWKCDILIFVNSNCLDFTAKTFVPKANKQLSELCLWLLGDKLFLLWLVAGKVWTRRGGGWAVPGSEVKSFLFCFCLLLFGSVFFCLLIFEQFLNTTIRRRRRSSLTTRTRRFRRRSSSSTWTTSTLSSSR